MVASFFGNNPDFVSAEMKGIKAARSTRDNYGDAAIGYVQVKREGTLCIVKGKITPEHRVQKKAYTVILKCDEEDGVIISVVCEDCAASQGGCKHAVAFLTWLHRRSEELSTTSVQCYWKKSTLSSVGTSIKFMKAINIGQRDLPHVQSDGTFLKKVLDCSEFAGRSDTSLGKYFKAFSGTEKLSIHYLLEMFISSNGEMDANSFEEFCINSIDEETCIHASLETTKQANSPLWHELRFARITASKAYSAMHCKVQGVLAETILGATKLKCTTAMQRGQQLEKKVLATVKKKFNLKAQPCGPMVNNIFPFLGASPDTVTEDSVVEIKCPTTLDDVKKYITLKGEITARYKAQVQMGLYFYKKSKAIFCVAHHDYEETENVTTIVVNYDEQYSHNLFLKCSDYWKQYIFPILIK